MATLALLPRALMEHSIRGRFTSEEQSIFKDDMSNPAASAAAARSLIDHLAECP